MYKIKYFVFEKDCCPFKQWLHSLDMKNQARIDANILRMEMGNLGDCKALKDGIYEKRLFFGKGYRLYFGLDGKDIILLLSGGDKGSQKQDIKKAKDFWRIYND